MWQASTFDPDTIDRELGWAAALGMNAVRVYLHNLLHEADGDAFLDRVDRVLEITHGHGIGMMPVLFDGVWHPAPRLGRQGEPTPHLHNSMWVQAPGGDVLQDRSAWPGLRPYVVALLERFGTDPRVLAWDLFNEPDQIDITTITSGSRSEKAAAATALVDVVFDWAREIDPSQPLTVGVWEYDDKHRPVANAMNRVALERSDIVSFHCYEARPTLNAVIDVDAIDWGLVDGRTQTRFPWRSWTEPVGDDEPWFHELLRADGSPYSETEAATFRRLTASRQT